MSGLFSSYFSKLFCICACSLVCEIVCHSVSQKNSGIFQTVKIICSLCICITVFSAFFSSQCFTEDLDKITSQIEAVTQNINTENNGNGVIESIKIQLENDVSKNILKKTGINPVSVSIQLNIKFEDDEKVIDLKNVYISVPEATTTEEICIIKNYVNEILGCQTYVQGEAKNENT